MTGDEKKNDNGSGKNVNDDIGKKTKKLIWW